MTNKNYDSSIFESKQVPLTSTQM